MPTCGGEPVGMDNAFACLPDGYIAWDAAWVADGYAIDDSFVYVMAAHEIAHTVQHEVDPSLLSAGPGELQADCLAGATLAGAVDDGVLAFEQDDAQGLVDVFEYLGDAKEWGRPGDHGTGRQRVEAFHLGLTGGVGACMPTAR
jgi:predicted metalloprotease